MAGSLAFASLSIRIPRIGLRSDGRPPEPDLFEQPEAMVRLVGLVPLQELGVLMPVGVVCGQHADGLLLPFDGRSEIAVF